MIWGEANFFEIIDIKQNSVCTKVIVVVKISNTITATSKLLKLFRTLSPLPVPSNVKHLVSDLELQYKSWEALFIFDRQAFILVAI